MLRRGARAPPVFSAVGNPQRGGGGFWFAAPAPPRASPAAAPPSAETGHAAVTAALPEEDATDIPLVTIDPRGSRDLDQALHIARSSDGYLVSYAIADLTAFVRPGGAIDEKAPRRGETLYFPALHVPLHPPVLSEDAASLLPGQLRPALLWRIQLTPEATVRSLDVGRARVRSTAQLDYEAVQHALDAGTLPDPIAALPEVGRARLALARARHAINLDLPEQRVEQRDGEYRLSLRAPLPVEQYNAEISLL